LIKHCPDTGVMLRDRILIRVQPKFTIMIIAVDFDGTICTEKYPNIGELNEELVKDLIRCKNKGDKLILWTCRTGNLLKQAVEFCKLAGLEFDAVNENLPETINHFGDDSRKIYAHQYIDDKQF